MCAKSEGSGETARTLFAYKHENMMRWLIYIIWEQQVRTLACASTQV